MKHRSFFSFFIRVEGLNTPKNSLARGSLGTVKRYSTPNTIPFKKQHTPPDRRSALPAGLLILISLSLLFFIGASNDTGEINGIPNSIRPYFDNAPPDDILLGIGTAKAESDGESILQAEDRAREDLARQISTKARGFEYSSGESIQEQYTKAFIIDSRVIARAKNSYGLWWCVVELKKEKAEQWDNMVRQRYRIEDPGFIANILRVQRADLQALEYKREIVERNGMRIQVLDKEAAIIPEWALKPPLVQYSASGLGAAKLGDDTQSIALALERARRSLARSLCAEVTSLLYDLAGETENSYFANPSSVKSICDGALMPEHLLRYAKTSDGTWWVLLNCSLNDVLPEIIINRR